MTCEVIEVRSLLVQGSLEIPIQVTVDMDLGEGNVQAIRKYEELVNEHYKEPVFLDVVC